MSFLHRPPLEIGIAQKVHERCSELSNQIRSNGAQTVHGDHRASPDLDDFTSSTASFRSAINVSMIGIVSVCGTVVQRTFKKKVVTDSAEGSACDGDMHCGRLL